MITGLVWQACSGPGDRIHQKIDLEKNINISIHPYGRTIFAFDPQNLSEELNAIKDEYPIFLDGNLNDPLQLERMQAFISDTLLQRINKDCIHQYPKLDFLEKGLGNAFSRFHYFFPEEKIPRIYTYISGFDYEHRIQYDNDNLIIALDMYLGADYANYQKLGLPTYAIRHFDEAFLLRDCFYNIGQGQIYKNKIGNKLLDAMINEGKLLWFTHLMIPELEDEILMDYTSDQMKWAKQNEEMVWAFLLENEMLYSANSEFRMKWINDAPFTSFFGSGSPPRVGMWIGYRIVNNFMEHNSKVNPAQLMQIYDAQKILKDSHFKPGQYN